ncbi:hypothetical protein CMI37_33875 [Candidatus Pacearchaeota archaeon]|nr:hypothetical protein [Candidatus Pacearchaeota archaeon]|tara:strand:- start:634 stop:1413 length:780 start_codon:yes stop_codon:yes gene_type:complete
MRIHRNILKLLQPFLMVIGCGAISLFALYSLVMSHAIPPQERLQENNYTSFYAPPYQQAIKKSRESAVQVTSFALDSPYFSTASGTYFAAYGKHFVVTVMHALQGPCEFTTIVHGEEGYGCVKYVTMNPINDYAIIQVEAIKDRTPIHIPRDLPQNAQWIDSYSIMNKLVYTGYPNVIGPLTVGGEVSGFADAEYIYMISYAWSGSSGSGVFDHRGKYIGYVVAIDVGQTEFGFQILQNVVLVAPALKVDWGKTLTQSE